MIIGIDPGCTGAIVVLQDDFSYVASLAMPTAKVGTKSRVNGAAIAAFLLAEVSSKPAHAYLEKVGAMPGQGCPRCSPLDTLPGWLRGFSRALAFPIPS